MASSNLIGMATGSSGPMLPGNVKILWPGDELVPSTLPLRSVEHRACLELSKWSPSPFILLPTVWHEWDLHALSRVVVASGLIERYPRMGFAYVKLVEGQTPDSCLAAIVADLALVKGAREIHTIFVDAPERDHMRLRKSLPAWAQGAGIVNWVLLSGEYSGLPEVANDLLRGISLERRNAGLRDLQYDRRLGRCALRHAMEMSRLARMGHTGRDGSNAKTRARSEGYACLRLGENLALGTANSSQILAHWMHSDAHRFNLLGDYEDVGVGIAASTRGADHINTACVAVFATS